MSDIKLYGKIHNQDGNLLISPLEVAGVNNDGSIPEGAATSKNNIVSYINEKIKGVNTNVGNIKTGIKSININNPTIQPNACSATITITANDSSHKDVKFSLDAANIVKGATIDKGLTSPAFGTKATLATLKMNKWDGSTDSVVNNIDITLPDNNAVGVAWEKSTSYTKYTTDVVAYKDAQVLTNAKNYANEQIKLKIGKVYKPQGNADLTSIVTINPSEHIGDVWNMTEKFKIAGKVYPQYTNIVIIDGVKDTSLNYDKTTGFSDSVVDALGGMFDQTAIQNDIDAKFNKSIVAINAPTIATIIPRLDCDIIQTITYTLGNGTPGTFNITLHSYGIPVAGTDELGLVSIGRNVEIDGEGCINVPTADSTGNIGLVKSDSSSSISISGNGELDIKLATNSGITKSSTGELSITKNTFSEGTGIKITKTGNDFSIGFNTTYTVDYASPTGKPLYYNTNTNAFYISSDNNVTLENIGTGKELKISLNMANIKTGLGLSSKADVSTVKDLTSRVEALESLLSLG